MKPIKKILTLTLCILLAASSCIIPTFSAEESSTPKYTSIPASYIGSDGLYYSVLSAPEAENSTYSLLPATYDSREAGFVTPVRNQGSTSTCWAHAALAACESSMLAHNQTTADEDFSELHLSYTAFNEPYDALGLFDSYKDPDHVSTDRGNWVNHGGNNATSLNTLVSLGGPVKESANHGLYSNAKLTVPNSVNFEIYNPEEYYSFGSMNVKAAYNVYANDPNSVKKFIMEYGAGILSINSKTLNTDTSTFYSYYGGSDHRVAIVGWDDNYPRENCEVNGYMPENDGAWLVKNSWGEENGINGYFWVSYEDQSITDNPLQFIELEDVGSYSNIYQYDDIFHGDHYLLPYYFENTSGESKYDFTDELGIVGGGTMANVYVAQKDNEVLKSVGFSTANTYLNYEVTIYKYNGEELVYVSTTSGFEAYEGYFKVDLDTPVPLAKGEKFMVAVKLYNEENPNEAIRFIHDLDDTGNTGVVKVTEYGESLFHTDKNGWVDLKDSVNGNFRIKAFTDSDDSKTPVSDYYYSFNGATRDELLGELTNLIGNVYSETIFQTYTYSKSSLKAFTDYYYYALSAVFDNPDIHSAQELYYIIQTLNAKFEALEPFDIMEYAKPFLVDETTVGWASTLKGYDAYISSFDELVAKASEDEITEDSLNRVYVPAFQELYKTIILEAIRAGYGDSQLQLRGDTNGDGKINIKDATIIQKILTEQMEHTIYSYNSGNCDRDTEITVKDATHIQKYCADFIDYLGYYECVFNWLPGQPMFVPSDVDRQTAVANLQNAVLEVPFSVEILLWGTEQELVLAAILMDANEVIANPENYHPQVIEFKAKNVSWFYNFVFGSVG